MFEQQHVYEQRAAGRKRSWLWVFAFGCALSFGMAVGLIS
jgi:hypothetical protein